MGAVLRRECIVQEKVQILNHVYSLHNRGQHDINERLFCSLVERYYGFLFFFVFVSSSLIDAFKDGAFS